MFPYKLVVFDIDGTIKYDSQLVSRNFLEIIDTLKSQNCFVTIATGRMSLSAKNNSIFVPNAPIITYQGAQILDYETLNNLNTINLDKQFIPIIIDKINSYNVKTMVQYEGSISCDSNDEWLKDYAIRNEVEFTYDENYQKSRLVNPLRIVLVGNPSDIENIEYILNEEFSNEVYVTRSLPHFCEILNLEADKSNSINWICNYLGIHSSKVLTFGDSYNDIKMLKNLGYGVAVENAVPELKAVSKHVLEKKGVEGIYEYLKNLVF